MKDKQNFDTRMMQYSEEALKEREQELLRQKRLAQRSKFRSAILGLLFIGGCVLGCLYHATIRDTMAKWIGSEGPGHGSEKAGDPGGRNAKLQEAIRKAKEHAATVDNIMDGKDAPKTP